MLHRECTLQIPATRHFVDLTLPIISDLTSPETHRLDTTPPPKSLATAHLLPIQDTLQALQIMQENLAGYHQGLPQGRAASLSIRECLDRWRWDDRQGQKKHMGDVMRWADLRLAWNTTLKELVCDLIRTRIGTGQNASEWVK